MRKNPSSKQLGFTLVELIVVIAIISLLSSIVLTAVDYAKYRARDAAIISAVHNLRTDMEQEFIVSHNYGTLLGTDAAGYWMKTKDGCDEAGFGGTYGPNVIAICKNIMTNTKSPNDLGITAGELWIGPGYSYSVNPSITPKNYVIMVYLPGAKKFYCYGYDGENSSIEDGSTVWGQPGCWSNY